MRNIGASTIQALHQMAGLGPGDGTFVTRQFAEIDNVVDELSVIPIDIGDLLAIVGMCDADPLGQERFTNRLQVLRGNRKLTLPMVESMRGTRFQKNMLEDTNGVIVDLGLNTVGYLISPAQSGKTFSILFSIWSAGIRRSMPSIFITHNGGQEVSRLAVSVKNFNKLIRTFAEMMGIPTESVPVLRLFSGKEDGFIRQVRIKDSSVIPVYATMGNYAKMRQLKKVIKNVSPYVEREVDINDEDSTRLKMFLVIDEADNLVQAKRFQDKKVDGKVVKGADGKAIREFADGRLSREMNSETEIDMKIAEGPRRKHFVVDKKSSIWECFSTILCVTATPQAIVIADRFIPQGRHIYAMVPNPSVNYWSFAKKENWECKIINNKIVSNWEEMLDDIMKDNRSFSRHSLVSIFSKVDGTFLTLDQDVGAMSAIKRHPKCMSISWSGEHVSVFSTCKRWHKRFEETGAFDILKQGVIGDDRLSVFSYTSKKENLKMSHFLEDGKLNVRAICSYPMLMSFIYKFPIDIPRTILFALNMVLRCTPVKGCVDHEGFLTDMYTEIKGCGNDEFYQQLIGRLSGLDRRTQDMGKTLWCSRGDLVVLYDGMDDVPNLVDKVNSGLNFSEACVELEQEIIEREHPSITDTYGATNKKSLIGKTRKGIETSSVMAQSRLNKRVREEGVEIERAAPRQRLVRNNFVVSNIQAPPPNVFVSSIVEAIEEGEGDVKETVFEQHGEFLRVAIRTAVETIGRVSMSRMREEIVGDDNHPDSSMFPEGFTVDISFVRYISDKVEFLKKIGIIFENGIFSERLIFVSRESLDGSKQRAYDSFVAAYNNGGFRGEWVARSVILRLYASENMQPTRGRITEIEQLGVVTYNRTGLLFKKIPRGSLTSVYVKFT